ncbi:MAG: ABC transporter ATP-binding protein [Deltaproteobacteria bacterium]|nr:ABC transporter ATP-binding protein [Deltaproteobacteria bacterium]
MLKIDGIDVFYGDISILRDISFTVAPKEMVCIVGGNGVGKTTLIKTISGLIRPKKGSILFEGTYIDQARTDEIVEKGLVQVPEGRKLFGNMTVWENLELGGINRRAKLQRKETIEKVFHLFPILKDRASQIAGTLSGGEQQMLCIGRSIMGLPRLLMLDEPSLGLSPIMIMEIFETIRNLNKKEKIPILLVEQNLKASLQMCHRGYVLENGRIVLQGTGKELLEDEHTKKAYLGM